MGNTLGRYVLREVVTAWLLVTGVLLVILLVNQMVGVLERAAASQYPEGVVLEHHALGILAGGGPLEHSHHLVYQQDDEQHAGHEQPGRDHLAQNVATQGVPHYTCTRLCPQRRIARPN